MKKWFVILVLFVGSVAAHAEAQTPVAAEAQAVVQGNYSYIPPKEGTVIIYDTPPAEENMTCYKNVKGYPLPNTVCYKGSTTYVYPQQAANVVHYSTYDPFYYRGSSFYSPFYYGGAGYGRGYVTIGSSFSRGMHHRRPAGGIGFGISFGRRLR